MKYFKEIAVTGMNSKKNEIMLILYFYWKLTNSSQHAIRTST